MTVRGLFSRVEVYLRIKSTTLSIFHDYTDKTKSLSSPLKLFSVLYIRINVRSVGLENCILKARCAPIKQKFCSLMSSLVGAKSDMYMRSPKRQSAPPHTQTAQGRWRKEGHFSPLTLVVFLHPTSKILQSLYNKYIQYIQTNSSIRQCLLLGRNNAT